MNVRIAAAFFCLLAAAWAQDRPRLTAQVGHGGEVDCVAVSPNGAWAATGGTDRVAVLWDIATGSVLQRFVGHTGAIRGIAVASDGSRVATASADGSARIWDTRTGRELRRLKGHGRAVLAVAFSPDGASLLTGGDDRLALLWDARTGEQRGRYVGHYRAVRSVAFSADGKRFLTRCSEWAALWDPARPLPVRLINPKGAVSAAVLGPDTKQVLTFTRGTNTALLWSVEGGGPSRVAPGEKVCGAGFRGATPVVAVLDGESVRVLDARTGAALGSCARGARWVDLTADARFAVTALPDRTLVVLHDLVSGRRILLDTRTAALVAATWTGRHFAVGGRFWAKKARDNEGTATLWDTVAGRPTGQWKLPFFPAYVSVPMGGRHILTGERHLHRLEVGRPPAQVSDPIVARAFVLPGGKTAVIGALRKSGCAIETVDLASGRAVRRFPVQHPPVLFGVTPSGSHAFVLQKSKLLWCDLESGRTVHELPADPDSYWDIAVDRHAAVTGGGDGTARLWNLKTGKEARRFEGGGPVWRVALSRRHVAAYAGGTNAMGGSLIVWDRATGRELHRSANRQPTAGLAFSPDGRWLLLATLGHASLLSTRDWRAACRVISFRDGDWAVVDDEGRYDAANGGDIDGLHWVVGLEPIALAQLKERYYEPGLLAKVLAGKPLRPVRAFTNPKLYPVVRATVDDGTLTIRLRNRGGGIGRVIVRINGKELTADVRPRGTDPTAATLTTDVRLEGDPRLKPGEDNRIEVLAYNADGYLRSRGLTLPYRAAGAARADPPRLWAVVSGVSDYRGDRIDLKYAAKDAEDFAAALALAGKRLFEGRVSLTLLTTPTRADLLAALDKARAAKPDDVLVVYLAGHGVNYGGEDGDFYYLTADAASASLKDPEVRARAALASAELTERINAIPALKQVLILDTCASGRLVEKLTVRRDVPSSQVRALERMKDRTGLFVLAGCAADRVSYEASRYAQGLLTHSLLLGMRGAALREEEFVDVQRLLGFAADRVPQLARDIGGIQRPIVAAPRGGGSFDIGRLIESDRARVPLQTVRPLFLRTNFQEEDELEDVLELARLVDRRLNDVAATSRDAPLVFVDARAFPGAYRLAGRYTVADGTLTARIRVSRGKEKIATLTVKGAANDLDVLAAKIVAAVQKTLE